MSKVAAYHTYVWKGSTDLALTQWPVKVRVKQMSLGLCHSAFLTHDGQVLCCGQNSHGQLGIGSNSGMYMEPNVVTCLEDEDVSSVAVGMYHTVCGTRSGRVYCWGDSTQAQCASTDLTQYTTPTCVATFNSSVKKVECCATSSVALLADGRLFAWGTGPVFKDSSNTKQRVVDPSPFGFIEDRVVLDVSCGTNFIVAVIKKTTVTQKKLVSKNNYVIVHKSDSELEAFNSDEHNRVSSGSVHHFCPLGLEVAVEHICLPFSAQNSPSSLRKFNLQVTRSPSTRSNSVSKLSGTSSVESLTFAKTPQITEPQEDVLQVHSLDRSRSMSSLSHSHLINVDQSEAELWLKQRLGSQFSLKDELPSVVGNVQLADSLSPPQEVVGGGPKVRERLPQYVENMWSSISSSSQAVSSAVQTHIVSKIPLLEKLTSKLGTTESAADDIGLIPIVLPAQNGDDPLNNPQQGLNNETREDNSPPSLYKSVTSRTVRHAESSSTASSSSHSRNGSRNGSRSGSRSEFRSPACIATEIWSWGSGDYGQLGHGDCLDRLHPCMVSSFSECQVYKVQCSQHSTVALTTDGKVYGWGDNSNKQLLYKHGAMVLHPTHIPISLKLPVVDISLGTEHALLQVISPVNVVTKGGIFSTGSTSQNELGTRLQFTRNLGRKLCMGAGPSGVSSICVQVNADEVYRELAELNVTEIQLYRVLLDIQTELVEPIIQSDCMAGLLDSPLGECLQNMFENLFYLIDRIGLNTQELSAVVDPDDLQGISLVGNCKLYMNSFSAYATHFHNLLSMNGLTQLVDKVKPVLLKNVDAITSLLERCQLEFSDELLVKVSVLLQLPLRRVSEYHDVVERIQLRLEDGSLLVSCLNSLEKEKLHLSSQYNLAESTRIFWEKWPKSISAALKEPYRRLVRESKSLSLALVGGSKLFRSSFVLFNDVFVQVQGSVHKVYPLEKLWIEATDSTSPVHEIKLIMPEASLHVVASNTAEKAEWMWILSQTVTLWLSSYKSGSSEHSSVNHHGAMLRTTPASRVATHMFYKAGPLQGAVYKGKWLKGVMHGEGQITWADGKVYTGQFADSEIKGYGKMTAKIDGNTETMEGYWNKGKLHGFAKTRYASGDLYTGFYKDHQFCGHGVLKQKSTSSVYIGEWKDGKRHGYGVLDSKGEKYLGQWFKDVKQGPALQISLDGCYLEGSFSNNKLIGQGLIMTSDDTYYEGNLTGLNEVHGKGTMVMSSGDSISGTFDGSFASGIKVAGTYRKAIYPGDMESCSQRLPKLFGTLSTSHDLKWMELFHHSKVALGCQGGELDSSSDCEKAWEKVAVLFANLRTRHTTRIKKRLYSEQLEKIPEHNLPILSLEHYRCIRKYLLNACDCDLHPLGLLLANLVDVYRTSYSGTGTHHRLLLHAREELLSITHRYYDMIRILFPELPVEHSARKILSAASLRDLQNTPVTNLVDGTDISEFTADHITDDLANDIQLEDQQRNTIIAEDKLTEESEVITPTLLIFPVLMPKIYEPLFHLYALQNEASDEQYWSRIQKFNKQCDLTLLSYLGIPERFWILSDGSSIDSSPNSMEIRDECFVDAIYVLQRLSTCLTPAEKLHAVQLTFDRINTLVKEKLTEKFVWSMDDLFPVFLFVVIRSRLRYLGSEIQLMDDLMDSHLEYGELGLMFTTLKACHLQIQTEKLL